MSEEPDPMSARHIYCKVNRAASSMEAAAQAHRVLAEAVEECNQAILTLRHAMERVEEEGR